MPFTLSHAAAALPLQRLLRGRAVLALLVIGSFIPDLPYFLPEPLTRINAHRLPGMILFGIPCGWLLYALWRYLLLAPIASLLPRAGAGLLLASQSQPPHPVRVANGTLCLLLGALSHVVWDAFTHQRGLIVHVLPALAHPLVHVGGHGLPSYFFFQHGSTLLGFVVLFFCARQRLRDATPAVLAAAPASHFSLRERIALLALLLLGTIAVAALRLSAPGAPVLCVYTAVCSTISAACVVTIAYAVAWQAGARSTQD